MSFNSKTLDNLHILCSNIDGNSVDTYVTLIKVYGTCTNIHIVNSTVTQNDIPVYGHLLEYSAEMCNFSDAYQTVISHSIFENNTVGTYGYLIEVSGTTAISCNTFVDNKLGIYGSLMKLRDNSVIANSTFANNNVNTHGYVIECHQNCLIFSSVFKYNVAPHVRYGILFSQQHQLSILASEFAHNHVQKFFNYEVRAIDCTHFFNNSIRSQQSVSMNSTTCNHLLLIGEKAVCQHFDCKGINMVTWYTIEIPYI